MFNKKKFSVFTSFLLSIFLIAGVSSLQAQGNVVEVINNSNDHTIFAELLTETGLEDVVSQEGPYTVVAPTDQAFEEMDTDVEELKTNHMALWSLLILSATVVFY